MAATWTVPQKSTTSNRRALIFSLVLGLLAAFLLFRVLTSAQSKSAAPPTVPVLVAKQDISARTVVTDSMVTIKQVPASLRLSAAFTNAKSATGQVVRSPISAGEQVLTGKLAANPLDIGFSGQVPAGMRAVSINATEVANSGNLVQPGDSVDVIAIFARIDKAPDDASFLVKESDNTPKRLTSVTLAQDVKVLAVAQAFDETPSASPKPAKSQNSQTEIKTVTLAVTPDDAQKLFLGDETGILRLSLHRFDDHDTAPLQPLDNSVRGVVASSQTNSSQSTVPTPESPQR
jgi:pilus assembly protein CpaB